MPQAYPDEGRLPEQESELWDWPLAHDSVTALQLLAYCASCAIKPERGAAADRLAP